MRRGVFYLLCSIILSALSGCKNREVPASATDQAIPVTIQEIAFSSVDDPDYYVGTVEESVSVPLSFLTTGMVEKVYVSEGQKVKRGQLLAELNQESYENVYQMALSKEKQAEDAYFRLSGVYEKGSLPEIKFIEIQTALEQAKSATRIAEKSLKDCKLYAPVNGIIGKREIEPGSNVIPGNPLLTIVKIEKVYVKIPVPEKEITGNYIGQKAKIEVSALNKAIFEGQIEEIGVMANPLSHTYPVKIVVSNPEEQLKPGMVGKVFINKTGSDSLIIIPQQAVIVNPQGEKFVYIADLTSETAVKRPVETGALKNNGVIITKGLQTGDQVIINGYQKLDANRKIQRAK